jgi:hypothetical protein
MHYATFKTALDFLLFYELIVAKKNYYQYHCIRRYPW